MDNDRRNVQRFNAQALDVIKAALAHGLSRLTIRRRFMRLNIWTGSFAAEESVTTVEPSDDARCFPDRFAPRPRPTADS
jgi:hypothetical protein